MDIPALEEIIQLSMVENEKKVQATQYLDQVRTADDRWNVGLKLFFDGKTEVAQFFGLSLVRDYMSNLSALSSTEKIREFVRESMKGWLFKILSQNMSIPNYIVNNVASIVTLSIKNDYPELWPTAFVELLQIGNSHSFNGVDVVIRVLMDLDHEVVMFNEGRTKSEIAHNVLIKDTMRQTNAIKDIVVFLCTWATTALAAGNKDLTERALLCLSEFVGWIDIYLVLNEALPTVFSLFQDKRTRTAAATCLYELAKKGMDPIAKVQMIHSIGLLPLLAALPPSPSGSPEENRQIGLLIDIVTMELIGCWSKFEDTVVFAGRGGPVGASSSPKVTSRKGVPGSSVARDSSKGEGESNPEGLLEIVSTVSQLLKVAMSILLSVFNHADVSVSTTVFPSCNRLITLLKAQSTCKAKIEALFQSPVASVTLGSGAVVAVSRYLSQESYFWATEYLDVLLMGIYRQLQYPADFDFSGCFEDGGVNFNATDDEDNDIVEAMKEVRKLFVNCCRVHPERCLQLVGAVLTALPQPISSAPFPALEAALRLVHAFSECGPGNSKLVSEGTFPLLVQAIHQTDIASHAHPQVLLSYFEISLRYIKLVDAATVARVMGSLVSAHGLRSKNTMVRNRSAYFVVKVAEAMEGKSSLLLSAIAAPLSDIIFNSGRNPLDFLTSSPSHSAQQTLGLSDAAELHLFECLGLMTSSTHYGEPGSNHDQAAVQQYQQKLLSDVTGFIVRQITEVVSNRSQLVRYVDQLSLFIAQKLSCLSCLAKGHNHKTHEFNVQYFDASTATVVSVLELLPQMQCIRSKAVVFLHRMVNALGSRCLLYITQALTVLVAHSEQGSDMEETVALLNQCLVEFQVGALNLAGRFHGLVVDKYKQLGTQFENNLAVSAPLTSGAVMEAPHIEAERVALQKQFLLYLQHIVQHNCHSVLTAPEHSHLIEETLNTLLVCVKGGRGGNLGTNAIISAQAGLPLRKGAIIVLTGLVKVWCSPFSSVSAETASTVGFVDNKHGAVPPQLTAAFLSFLCDHAVPAMLSSCSDGGRSVNVKDAAAQSVLVEMAALQWTLYFVLGTQAAMSYFTDLLTKLGWNSTIQQTFLLQLSAEQPLGTYKDTFKLFIRSCS